MRYPSGRILVADDDEPIRRLICVNLELEGFTIVEACDGRECLAAAWADPPDLITLDLVMPNMDGLATALRLRSDERTRNVPIVLLTGAATPRDRMRAEGIGVDLILTKPFVPTALVTAVRGLLDPETRMSAVGGRS